MAGNRTRRDWLLLAIYLAGASLLAATLFPRALHEDLRLLGPRTVGTSGEVITVTGGPRLRFSAIPGAILRGRPRPPRGGAPNAAQHPGSPVRLHRYDFEFQTADGERIQSFTFAGGGRYAPGASAEIIYLPTRPTICRLAATTREPVPATALVVVFPLVGIVVAGRLWVKGRRGGQA